MNLTVSSDVNLAPPAPFTKPPLETAFEVLNYNQQLIQFADAKAGNLIVINSLFIAAAQAGGLGGPLLLRLLQGSLILIAGFSVLICLAVIMSQASLPRMPRKDFIFFGDIAQRRSMEQYVRDFVGTNPNDHQADALRRTYVLALIARRKFSSYRWAQALTVVAAALWLTVSAGHLAAG